MMTPVKKTAAIRPVEFYGNGLPRPRFFDNPKFNSHRVDPPISVLDPLLSWARSSLVHGGSVDKLRYRNPPLKKRSCFHSPPAAPVAVKRRRYIDLNDDADDEEAEIGVASIRRKLSDDFDRVAGESNTKAIKKPIETESMVKKKTNKKKTQKVEEKSSRRSSPRLANVVQLVSLGFRSKSIFS
ncbi:hypothetical protein Bca52824_091105 [Brassica carinata]|uniref:Uncharacterized protein n=1 Tax=Brassica carinata TaxID=52824 RepID=A0A8X7NXR1_BRACI|nr:hypothetical protein Bca52824_091105 [Brassica carinata]